MRTTKEQREKKYYEIIDSLEDCKTQKQIVAEHMCSYDTIQKAIAFWRTFSPDSVESYLRDNPRGRPSLNPIKKVKKFRQARLPELKVLAIKETIDFLNVLAKWKRFSPNCKKGREMQKTIKRLNFVLNN